MEKNVVISPFYTEAKNAILRPDRALVLTRYFIENWMPRLGGTASCIVLCLRNMGGEIRSGEVAVQVTQRQIADGVGCSVRTLQRELAENAVLGGFVRMEERYVRGEKGRVRQMESIYFIAMDDPLIPEDQPRLEEILAKRPMERNEGKVILRAADVVRQNDVQDREDVVRQNDILRDAPLCDNLTHLNRYDKLSHLDSESNGIRNVSETRFRGKATETDSGQMSSNSKSMPALPDLANNTAIETWRKQTEDLARLSARDLDDQASLGYHIKVWNHARQMDRQKGGKTVITDGVFAILQELTDRRRSSGQSQGRAWTRRTRKWFDDMGFPLLVKADAEELEAVRLALADAPFRQREG